jgi:hypothetical protein
MRGSVKSRRMKFRSRSGTSPKSTISAAASGFQARTCASGSSRSPARRSGRRSFAGTASLSAARVLLRPADGQSFALPPERGPRFAELEATGLYHSYATPAGEGRIAFIPRGENPPQTRLVTSSSAGRDARTRRAETTAVPGVGMAARRKLTVTLQSPFRCARAWQRAALPLALASPEPGASVGLR